MDDLDEELLLLLLLRRRRRKNLLKVYMLNVEFGLKVYLQEDSPISNMCSDTCISYIGYNDLDEPLGGIPTTSIVLQDALVNGIICELIKRKKLTRKDFLANHPGGLLGERFSKI